MRTRQLLGVAMVATLALLGAACGGDDKADPTTTTAASSDDSTATTGPTTTISDEEFSAALAAVTEKVEGSGEGTCEVLNTVAQATMPQPGNPAQVEEFLNTYDLFFSKLAESVKAESPENAEKLSKAGKALLEAGEKAKFDPEVLNSDALNSPDFTAAQTVLLDLSGKCVPEAAGGGAVPDDTTGSGTEGEATP